ncbi:unnamed protein product, partial [Heterosigma akashiwo]
GRARAPGTAPGGRAVQGCASCCGLSKEIFCLEIRNVSAKEWQWIQHNNMT